MKKIIIGTRGSKLALWQAHFTKKNLEDLGHEVVLQIIKTKGDKIQNQTFDKMEGKGFFTKELEEALLSGDIDMAVHSYKDLPTEHPPKLIITANSYREDPVDWLLINQASVDRALPFSLKKGLTVGTSSPRRASQLLHFRPDLKIVPIRGNVPTRVKKMETEVDAVVLAAAGLKRLETSLEGIHKEAMALQQMIPAPAQGVLAFQCREEDLAMQNILKNLHDAKVEECINTERSILNRLEGGCQQPIGIYCKKEGNSFLLWAAYSKTMGEPLQRLFLRGTEPNKLISEAVKLLKNPISKKIFITRDLGKDSAFKNSLSQLRHQVSGNSLIDFKAVDFEMPESADYVFFSSKRGVRFFFKDEIDHDKLHHLFQNGLKIGAIGAVTASAIEELGFRCGFVGSTKDVKETAKEFALVAKGKKVFFPQAKNSQRSIQKELNSDTQIIDLVVYDNTPKTDFALPEADVLVFTSPMNVTTYLAKKKIKATQTIIAIGPTTANALKEAGYVNYRLPYAFDEVSLADVCY